MRIITHPGMSHRDELYAIALVLAKVGFCSVFRREPTADELEDPDVWCIDVGKVHDEAKHNFDHHQYRGEPSAVVLVWNYLYPDMELPDSLKVVSEMDVNGPKAYCDAHKMDFDEFMRAKSEPLMGWIMDNFGASDGLNDSLILFLQSLGKSIVQTAKDKADRLVLLDTSVQMLFQDGIMIAICSIPGDQRPTFCMEGWLKQQHPHDDVAVVISRDDRGPGWSLYRRPGHENQVDFNRVKNDPSLSFVHAGGFIAKTRDINQSLAETIVKSATIR